MTAPSSSLRELYSDPSSTWSFVPNLPAPNSNSSVVDPVAAPGLQWNSRPAHNSIFDLSPDLNEGTGINAVTLLKALTASAVLHYTSTAIAMPWEVGKLLLQVQWVPRVSQDTEALVEVDDDDDALSDTSNDNDSYFADPEGTPRITNHRVDEPPRRSVLEESTRPEYIIPVGSADGVWGMIKRVGGFRGEGWLALWKGLLTSCLTEILSSAMQPFIHNGLQTLFLPRQSLFRQPPIIFPVAAHLLTGFILSPLDLIRTRLIVQPFLPRHKNYTGPYHALQEIIRHEGGIKDIYFHPHLLIPTLIDNALRPIVSLALPGLLVGYFGIHITEEANPVAWGFTELASSCLGLLITLPVETVRRRLQAQVRGTAKPLKSSVQLRPQPYNGVVDAFWRILSEERSDLPLVRHVRKRRPSRKGKEKEDAHVQEDVEGGWLSNTGIGQLYRGMGMRLGASVIVFVLALVSGGDDNSGWAEL